MLRSDPSAEWERFGRLDPYYGVYALDEFRGRDLDEAARARFFASGDEHVGEVLRLVRSAVDPGFAPASVLDFGCGVGRLLVPFARIADHVVGVDVSSSMLDEAGRNCYEFGVADVELLHVSELEGLKRAFDLVHSAIVLQHMPVEEGERTLVLLAELLRPGGVGVHQVLTHGRLDLALYNRIMKLPLAHEVLNVLRGRPWAYPHMQMNAYDIGRLVQLLAVHDVPGVYVRPEAPYAGWTSCTIVFQRAG